MAKFFRGRGPAKATRTEGATQLLPETAWASEALPSGTPPEGGVVVTISRQYGSGGGDIGRLVSQQCGLNYLDNEIITAVAQRLGVNVQEAARQDEYTAGAVGHILEAIQSSHPFNVNYNHLLGSRIVPAQSNEIAYLHLTQKVILELATEGNTVIVGRGAQFLLHNAPRTLHIYVFAPLPYRIAYIMKQQQVDHEQAQHIIEQRDYEQETYLRRFYGSDGNQPGLYHLLINTGLFPFELAASLIQQVLEVAKGMR
jgi:cytidylate kinase